MGVGAREGEWGGRVLGGQSHSWELKGSPLSEAFEGVKEGKQEWQLRGRQRRVEFEGGLA